MSFYAEIHAKSGTVLRGGVKKVRSSKFSTLKEARDWLYGMDQPNIGDVRIILTEKARRGKTAR